MNQKQLILFGTRHYTESNILSAVQDSLTLIIDVYRPSIALEEWSVTQAERSGVAALCAVHNIPWESIGTPPQEPFRTYGPSDALDDPVGHVSRYGPLDAQERREAMMCDNIDIAMCSYEIGLVVIGIAHLHSMMTKLALKKYEVSGYGYRLEPL